MNSYKSFVWSVFALVLLAPTALVAQAPTAFAPDKMDTILYGAAYYHEYMPYERLDKDVELMKKAGINVVRVGESTWGLWEPEEGKFEYAWMDRVIDRMHQAGIRVILGTPTYSIPAWLYKKHPEIVVTKLGGEYLYYGLRQNVDLSNPVYRTYCERVIRKILQHYKDNPAVIGYQIDNETFSYGIKDENVQKGFAAYLQKKFKTVDELNRVWGLNYWGQQLNNWSELPPRDGILNPGWKLEFERYTQSMPVDFLVWQRKIVAEYKRPDQFVTHDLAGPPNAGIDELGITAAVDIMAANPYHDTQELFDGADSSLRGDYTRSLMQTNYLITETNAQTIGWDAKDQYPPYDGQLRLDVYTHLSSGANMVEYWHWHSLHYGQETYWKGVLSHDLEPGRAYEEVSKIAHELQRIGPEIVNLKRVNEVAILYSNDSGHGISYMPYSDQSNYYTVLRQIYMALYRQNVSVDFVFPTTRDLSRYKVILVPPLYVASDELLNRLSDYVNHGGNLVVAFKSGFTNEYSTVRWTMAPGPLRKAAGLRYQEFSRLRKPLALKGDPFKAGEKNLVSEWADMLVLEGAQPLAYYEHPFFGNYPAITRNRFGGGTLTYEGTVLTDELQQKVMSSVLESAGLLGPDQSLPAAVRVKHGTNGQGKTIHYYLNYSSEQQMVTYPYKAGTDLLSGSAVKSSQQLTLKPWDAMIVREQ